MTSATLKGGPMLLDNSDADFEVYHLPKAGAMTFGGIIYFYEQRHFDPIKFMGSSECAVDPHFSSLSGGKLPTYVGGIHPSTVLKSFQIKHFVFIIKMCSNLTYQELLALPLSEQKKYLNLKLRFNEIVHNEAREAMKKKFKKLNLQRSPESRLSMRGIHLLSRGQPKYAMYRHGCVGLNFAYSIRRVLRTIMMFMRRVVFHRRCARRALMLAMSMADHPRLGENAACKSIMKGGDILSNIIGPMVMGAKRHHSGGSNP